MPTITFFEPGTDVTGDLSNFTFTIGTVTSDPGTGLGGTRSLKLDTGAGEANAQAVIGGGLVTDAGGRSSVWVRVNSFGTGTAALLACQTSGTANVIIVRLLTTGIVRLSAIGASNTDTTSALSTDTWYRIAYTWVITDASNFTIKLYLHDGTGLLETITAASVAGSGGTLTNTSMFLHIWNLSAGSGANRTANFDNLYLDDGTDLSDPGPYPRSGNLALMGVQ